jgi:hypothetical protein
MNAFGLRRWVSDRFVWAAWLALVGALATATGEAADIPGRSAGTTLTPGVGIGLGSTYATLGMSGSFGSDHLRAEVAVGTEPFVWSRTYAAGATVLFLDPEARVRPRLSLFVKSNASSVTVLEPEVEGKIQNDVEYDPFAGIAALGGFDIRLFEEESSSFWLALNAGYRTPFAGMDEVNRRADEYLVRYGPTGHEVKVPRWDHFTFSVGFNVRLPGFSF